MATCVATITIEFEITQFMADNFLDMTPVEIGDTIKNRYFMFQTAINHAAIGEKGKPWVREWIEPKSKSG